MDTKFSMALHILVMVSEEKNRQLSSQDLATSVGTNASHIRKLTRLLKEAGLLTSHQGKQGFFLGQAVDQMTLRDIYLAVYPQKQVLHVHEDANPDCPVGSRIEKVLTPTFNQIETELLDRLNKQSLADLIQEFYKIES